ncbi:MAG: hypothetical protein ABII71_01370 [Candidatus Micrarchaeota archaeon]
MKRLAIREHEPSKDYTVLQKLKTTASAAGRRESPFDAVAIEGLRRGGARAQMEKWRKRLARKGKYLEALSPQDLPELPPKSKPYRTPGIVSLREEDEMLVSAVAHGKLAKAEKRAGRLRFFADTILGSDAIPPVIFFGGVGAGAWGAKLLIDALAISTAIEAGKVIAGLLFLATTGVSFACMIGFCHLLQAGSWKIRGRCDELREHAGAIRALFSNGTLPALPKAPEEHNPMQLPPARS